MLAVKISFFVLLVWFFSGCDCDKQFHCGAVSADNAAWIHGKAGDTLLFADGLNDTISIKILNVTESQPKDYNPCKKNELGGCDCEERCSVNKSFFGQSDSAGGKAGTFSQNNLEETVGKISSLSKINYYVFDFWGDLTLTNPIHLEQGDTLYPNLTLGNTTYTDVYMLQRDTTNINFVNNKVNKIYITKSDGIVGFDLRFLSTTHEVKSYFRVK